MAEYIDKAALYAKIAKLERDARKKLDNTSVYFPTSGASEYIKNSTWLSALTMVKHIIADFPTVDSAITHTAEKEVGNGSD